MKNLFKITAFVFLTLNFLGCSSDSSETPCTTIACLNNGVSNSDCGCDCPLGYSGTNCGTIVTPSKVIITKVVVKAFNNLNSGGIGYDLANGPDIYIKINSGNTVLYDHPNIFSNATSGLDTNYQFVLTPNSLEITNVNSPLVVSLWDYDLGDIPSNADDNMASAVFFPFNGNSFPTSIIITDPTSPTKFEVFLSYQF